MNLSSLSTILSKSISKNITIKWVHQKTILLVFHKIVSFKRHCSFIADTVGTSNLCALQWESIIAEVYFGQTSVICFARDLVIVCFIGVCVIVGCPQGERWLYWFLIKFLVTLFGILHLQNYWKFLSFDFWSSFERVI